MFDVHCHILPGIDDGSKNVQMSLDMLKMSAEQGVEGIIFTPHFYADMNSPEKFFDKRSKALAELESGLGNLSKVPKYAVGAEVHYFRGMSRYDKDSNNYLHGMFFLVFFFLFLFFLSF